MIATTGRAKTGAQKNFLDSTEVTHHRNAKSLRKRRVRRMRHSQTCDSDVSGTTMLELIATLVVDLSDQTLTVLNEQEQTVRVIPVSTGKASSSAPTGHASVLTKYRSVTMRGRTYVSPGKRMPAKPLACLEATAACACQPCRRAGCLKTHSKAPR